MKNIETKINYAFCKEDDNVNNDEIKKAAKGIADYLSEYPLWDYGAKWSIQEIQDLVGKLRRLTQSDLRTAKDEGRVKPGCGLFSNMCSEEIKEVAIRLHANNELLPKNMILQLIGNLADVVMRMEDRLELTEKKVGKT